MWIPIILAAGGLVLYFCNKSQSSATGTPTPAAPAQAAGTGLVSGGAYFQGYVDQINMAADVYDSSSKTPGVDDTTLMKTLNAIMAAATNDSQQGNLTTTDMFNLNQLYKSQIPS
jgi:hypothetical protein